MPWPASELPNLNANNSRITSEARNAYNCIAWAAGDTRRWWWPIRLPGVNYWPRGVPREETIDAFIAAFATVGYSPCADGTLQDGVEKIALYAIDTGSRLLPRHAARQLESGEWTSKLGRFEDVSHNSVVDVNGPVYGAPVCFMSRRRLRASTNN